MKSKFDLVLWLCLLVLALITLYSVASVLFKLLI